MEILYEDKRIFVVLKPAGVRSTDEAGGMPELLRQYLGDETACVRTVHRLDQVVGGVMVFARSAEAARRLSKQIVQRKFQKEYLAVVHGTPSMETGRFQDLLRRDQAMRKTFVTDKMEKGVQSATLHYRVLAQAEGLSLLSIQLETGRTHQIRAQFSFHGLPLAGDRKYGLPDSFSQIALWSHRLGFLHPETGEQMVFSSPPPEIAPWMEFSPACFG